MSYEIGTQFTVRLSSNPKLRETLQQIANETEANTSGELLAILIKAYKGQAGSFPKQTPKPGPPPTSDDYFVAKVDPSMRPLVQEMKDFYYQEHSWREEAIIKYLAQLTKAEQEGLAFIIKPPKQIAKKTSGYIKELIESGSIGSSIKFWIDLLKAFFKNQEKPKEPPKPEKKSFWDF